MKKIFLILGVLMSVPAFADSAKTVVGTFNGKLSIVTESLDVKKIDVEVINQFCNFWGTTCSGGPQGRELLPIITSESNDGKDITIVNETEVEVSSLKVGNRFSSCKVNLLIEAVTTDGKNVSGTKELAWVNDKKVCASKEQLTKIVRGNLANTLVVKDGGFFISIK